MSKPTTVNEVAPTEKPTYIFTSEDELHKYADEIMQKKQTMRGKVREITDKSLFRVTRSVVRAIGSVVRINDSPAEGFDALVHKKYTKLHVLSPEEAIVYLSNKCKEIHTLLMDIGPKYDKIRSLWVNDANKHNEEYNFLSSLKKLDNEDFMMLSDNYLKSKYCEPIYSYYKNNPSLTYLKPIINNLALVFVLKDKLKHTHRTTSKTGVYKYIGGASKKKKKQTRRKRRY